MFGQFNTPLLCNFDLSLYGSFYVGCGYKDSKVAFDKEILRGVLIQGRDKQREGGWEALYITHRSGTCFSPNIKKYADTYTGT
jgi:hypothetical protein